jgi:hypothetical protein
VKTLIVPDVHEYIGKLDALLKHAGAVDETVLLGDWFDSFERTETTTLATLGWLLQNHDRPEYILLWGNHDLPYAYQDIRGLQCSGHNWASRLLLAKYPEIWKRFTFAYTTQRHLLSHAGIHPTFISNIPETCRQCREHLAKGLMHPFVGAGRERGGYFGIGGCTWLDWSREFKPTDGIPQVVGHTRATEPRWHGNSMCIDTDLAYYALITDGDLSIHKV